MIFHCTNCHKELNEKDGNTIYFPEGKGRLCKNCYEIYDLKIKDIEFQFKVLRGFKGKLTTLF